MAKQEIDIGLEGNDGTGDSIRESFRKVNENFTEVYAVFGLGGQISFTSLDDTPDSFVGNEGKVPLVNAAGTKLDFYELVSDAGTNDPSDTDNTITFEVSGNKLIVKSINTKLSTDATPAVLNPLSVGAAAAYTNSINSLLRGSTADVDTLVASWNGTHGAPNITSDNLLISKGFADDKYVNTAGDTLTGHLNTIAGATGTQVPQRQEVVGLAGDTMTGPLTLHDHPFPFEGAGSPNSQYDLQAATKYYVDNSAFASKTNLFVSTSGDDNMTTVPPGKEGRSEAYAYRTVAAACAAAARIQEASSVDIGPYIQPLQYDTGPSVATSYVDNTVTYGFNNVSGDQATLVALANAAKSAAITNTISYINTTYTTFVYDQATCERDLGLIHDAIIIDIKASTVATKQNTMSIYAGLRYYSNPSGVFAISTDGQYTETAAAILYYKQQILAAIGVSLSTGNAWYQAAEDRFDDVLQTIDRTTDDPARVEANNYYTLNAYSGPDKYTIQSGDPTADQPNVDIFPGKVIRGRTTGAIGQIVSYERGIDKGVTTTYDTIELQLLSPVEFQDDELLDFGNYVKKDQISIRVETGIYEEQLPIKVPENVSIKGDEFRRAIIRPAPGVSTSPYARTMFYRDAEIDGLTTASGGEYYTREADSSVTGYFGYHYLTDPSDPASTPKNNNEMDVFLCNDAVILRNITCQQHGGFMMVLDPSGSILTRSPYAQTCTSFARSTNSQAFHGGMFIDGYTYNMPAVIVDKDDNFTIHVEAEATSILAKRKPKLPCSFFIEGRRYQVNAIRDYYGEDNLQTSVLAGDPSYEHTTGLVAKATLILDATSGVSLGGGAYSGYDTPADSSVESIIIQGGGNKSMLANDYTQINDLGYGVIAANNALSELVSVFTYYCYCGYYSLNGSQIRSLTGNNSYGTFGMVSEGSDPDEVATVGTLNQSLVQPVKVYNVEQIIEVAGDVSASLSIGETIGQTQGVGNDIITGKLQYWVVDTNTFLYVGESTGTFNDQGDIYEGSSTIIAEANQGDIVSIDNISFGAAKDAVAMFIFDVTDYPMNASEIEILYDAPGETVDQLYYPHEVVSVSETDIEIPASLDATLCDSANANLRRKVWRLDFSSGATTGDTGLREQVAMNHVAVFRSKQAFLLDGITSETLTRPSTALIFDEFPTFTYRTLAFENTIVGGIAVDPAGQARVVVDDNFNYEDLTVDNDRAAYSVGANYTIDSTLGATPTAGGTLGRNQGDTNFALSADLDDTAKSRIVGMVFTWAGAKHTITGYSTVTDTSGTPSLDGQKFGIVTFTDDYYITPAYSGSGLAARADSSRGDNNTLKGGIDAGETYNVTVAISTCRATSHDFLDIGTGGYNTSNYPDRIFGKPIVQAVTDEEAVDSNGLNNKAQVQERTRGRVFFASTDQDGFFRVGRFFTVDQGTGRVTFNAALVLTNIDGIGFKRGVRVNEFSADETFTNATNDTVATERATEQYINARLGWDREGDDYLPVIGGGAVRKAGDEMTGSLSMGTFQITNLGDPTSGTDAANKNYVDNQVAAYDELSELQDTNFTSLANGDILVYNTSDSKWHNEALATDDTSDISVTYTGGTLTFQLNEGVIENADVATGAAIAQSKLDMSRAPTFDESDPTTGWGGTAPANVQSNTGLAAFSDENFEVENDGGLTGRVRIKSGGISDDELAGSISNAKLSNSSITFTDGTSSTAASLGDTVTFQGTTNEVTVTESSGTFTIGLPADVSINTSLTVGNGMILTAGNIVPGSNSPTDSGQMLGLSTNRWNTVYATTFNGIATSAQYADLAENYLADAQYEPGTVLVLGGDEEVTVVSEKGSRRVVGVVTTNPAHLMNSALEGDHVVGIALQGRVPCKVLGRVQKGDLLVTAGREGYACVNNDPKVGTVIGKAVENKTDDGYGKVEVVVGRV